MHDPSVDPRAERAHRGLAWLERYAPLADDAPAFRAALAEPPPADVLIPPGRSDPETVAAWVSARGIPADRLSWAPHHLRLGVSGGLGHLPEVALGLAHPQGAASALPVLALDPARASLLLDLCAAPGGKTLYLSGLATGTRLVANELKAGRAGVLALTLARHGVATCLGVRHDGAALPRVGAFDRILVDAPCSGEGRFRAPAPRWNPPGDAALAAHAVTQRRLLERAAALLAPGGRLVYATCSLAPEENEAVLDDLLAAHGDLDVAAVAPDIPGLPGLAAWNGARFDSRLSRARRIFPHHTGSWSFFVAALERSLDAPQARRAGSETTSAPLADDPEARAILGAFLDERFGIPAETWQRYIITRNGRSVWILERSRDDVDAARLDVLVYGLRALRLAPAGVHATNALLRHAGAAATRHRIDLRMDDVLELLERERGAAPSGLSRGQVALVVEGVSVGAGFVDGRTMHLQIPRAWRG